MGAASNTIGESALFTGQYSLGFTKVTPDPPQQDVYVCGQSILWQRKWQQLASNRNIYGSITRQLWIVLGHMGTFKPHVFIIAGLGWSLSMASYSLMSGPIARILRPKPEVDQSGFYTRPIF